jgi:hypothetical protein
MKNKQKEWHPATKPLKNIGLNRIKSSAGREKTSKSRKVIIHKGRKPRRDIGIWIRIHNFLNLKVV